MTWHPSYDDLVAKVACPVCGAGPGLWCAKDNTSEDPDRDLHIDRILLARGLDGPA
jgi:hypothetical protein